MTLLRISLGVGGIVQKVRAAGDAGIKEVLLPADNLREGHTLAAYIFDTVKATPVSSIERVLARAFVEG